MMDVTQLANDAVAMLAPFLPLATQAAGKLADHVAEGFLSEPGAKLFDWMAGQFRGKPAAVTLERAMAEPQNKHRLEALRLEILELAEGDDVFHQRLEELVGGGAKDGVQANQTVTASGSEHKIAVTAGKGNHIQIS